MTTKIDELMEQISTCQPVAYSKIYEALRSLQERNEELEKIRNKDADLIESQALRLGKAEAKLTAFQQAVDSALTETDHHIWDGYVGIRHHHWQAICNTVKDAPKDKEVGYISAFDSPRVLPAQQPASKPSAQSDFAWSSLQAIIDYPITDQNNQDAANMKLLAIDAFTGQSKPSAQVPEHFAKFYQTTDVMELISIMEQQIKRLQERLPKNNQQIRNHVKEG